MRRRRLLLCHFSSLAPKIALNGPSNAKGRSPDLQASPGKARFPTARVVAVAGSAWNSASADEERERLRFIKRMRALNSKVLTPLDTHFAEVPASNVAFTLQR